MAGAPKGNKNARRGSAWREAVECALKSYEKDDVKRGAALKAIGKKLISMALDGDMQAIKEIGDRLDGKPSQTIYTDHNDSVEQLTDSVLENIASRGSARASKPKGREKELH